MSGVESQFRIAGPFVARRSGDRPRGSRWRVRLAHSMRELGAYGPLILPGGNLILLALWTLQHRTWLAARAQRAVRAAWVAVERLIFPR
jgi:hypothetical protein